MDALSDVLRIVRLKGGVFLHAEFTAPWCIASQIAPGDLGSRLEGADDLGCDEAGHRAWCDSGEAVGKDPAHCDSGIGERR